MEEQFVDPDQDNAPAHNTPYVKRFLAEKRIPLLKHHFYLPDILPWKIYLF